MLLLMLGALAAADYGRSMLVMRAGEPPGWKTERWQAGFGSWARGGYGVAYDISMPREYDLQQKCGTAWISGEQDDSDFSIRLSFRPDQKDRQNDFEAYLKEDAGRNYEGDRSALKMATKNNVKVGEFRFSRLDFTLDGAKFAAAEAGQGAEAGALKGFWLDGDRLSIISDLREAEAAAINERIIGTVRKASGYGVTELFARSIPGLVGC
jgi:hypothetical protein